MILSLVRVYFHYIFIYFHTRTILPIRIWAESFFPSRRYLSFVNRSRKICIHFHPSFSHIINRRIFVDFCSHITFPKKILLDFDPRSNYIDLRRSNISDRFIQHDSTESNSVIVAQFRACAKREREEGSGKKERKRERERDGIDIDFLENRPRVPPRI